MSTAVLDVVSPLAIDAAFEAQALMTKQQEERRSVLDLELEQARYEASLAERRYASCDPSNRLIAAELEKRWEETLGRVQAFERRLADAAGSEEAVDPDHLTDLARDLQVAWDAPQTSMRVRQRLIRTLIEDILADIDEDTGEIVLVVHWKGGRHTELRVMKPKPGQHGARTSEDALKIIREMAGRWPDDAVAACLNRMSIRTGQGKTWTSKRVSSIRRVNDIQGCFSSDKEGPWRTMTEAATELGVTNHVIRRLIKDEILPAKQVLKGAPYQIRVEDLHSEPVCQAIRSKERPRRTEYASQLSMFPKA
ncbi:MAG: DNA-binding protein [Rhodospirillum sp.]|nr:DNA-binding protein [Rhodospirillum sp.]